MNILSHTHTKSKSTHFDCAAFDHTFFCRFPSAAAALRDIVIKGWWVVFFILSFFQLSLHLSSLVRTRNFWQMLQPGGTEGREEGPCLFNLQRENVCVITGNDDSPCFRQRASRPWRPPLTHEYLARQLTVIGHCCEPSGLVCAHRRHVRQHTTVASHPRWF